MMEASKFIDYYELLEISPNANSGTIERMFRHFARHRHPDNKDTGNRDLFDQIVEAYGVLKDPAKRAQYDLQHKDFLESSWKLIKNTSSGNGIDGDVYIQTKLLSILYAKRRQDIRDPGVGNQELERLLGCPTELLEFHTWYLKEKAWIVRTENGTLAITAEGVDRVNSEHHRASNKLLADQRDTA